MQYYGTLGPSCGDEKILENMFRAGMTGIRLNLSHGDLDKSSHWLELLREAAKKAGIKGAPQILIDLQGPELRLGRNGITCELESGETVQLVSMGAAEQVREETPQRACDEAAEQVREETPQQACDEAAGQAQEEPTQQARDGAAGQAQEEPTQRARDGAAGQAQKEPTQQACDGAAVQVCGKNAQTDMEKEAEHRGAAKLCIPVPDMLLHYVEAGDRILVDDGKIELLVKEVSGGPAAAAAIGAAAPENVVAVNIAAAQMDTAVTIGAAAANTVTANTTASNITESPSDTAVTGAGTTGAATPATASTPTALPVSVSAVVVRPGLLKPGKSLAVIGKELPMPTLTDSDRKNIGMAAEYGVTGVMLPFVRNREDLLTLRSALQAAGAEKVEIFAKIENMQGVRAIDELLPWCDQIVIARGDLGNAMPLWKLPGIQKQLAASCRAKKKPFMVVTQMLDSMHERAVPTRAEVLDIYNAVLDGAASVMLTGETAAGRYPVEAMEYLVRTGEEAVKDRACKADR